MKKGLLIACTISAIFAIGCSKGRAENVVLVGASPSPHSDILNLIVDDMKEMGYELEVEVYDDYVMPNEAVESGELDANFFQHIPYMETFNEERGFHLVNVASTHVEPLALYSNTVSDYNKLPKGAEIAIPNDPTNEGRALLLLQSAGLIQLDKKSGLTAVPSDIVKNPKGFKFKEVDAAQLPLVLDDVDGAVINGNYAIPAGLTATDDGLLVEGGDSPYVNVIVVKSGMEKDPKIQALVKAITSNEVKEYIQKTYPNGEVIPVF